MRAILIDPTAKHITEIDAEIDSGDVRSLYKILGVDNVERAGPLPNGDMVYVDGNGLINANPGPYFLIEGIEQPLAGKGLLLGETRSGRLAAPRTKFLQATRAVSFPDIELAGFQDFSEIVRLPGLEGGVLVTGSQAVFRPKR